MGRGLLRLNQDVSDCLYDVDIDIACNQLLHFQNIFGRLFVVTADRTELVLDSMLAPDPSPERV